MTALCPFVDDSTDEAIALANHLQRNGVPFLIRPVAPAKTTLETYRLVTAARPSAVIVDYYLTAQVRTHSEDLACRFLDRGLPAVILTKDRDVADQGTVQCKGHRVPVYFKHQLISGGPHVGKLIADLGGQSLQQQPFDDSDRLYELQEKELNRSLTQQEKAELKILLSRVRLAETEEAVRIENAQIGVQKGVEDLIQLIRGVTTDLDKELTRHAVSKKRKRS